MVFFHFMNDQEEKTALHYAIRSKCEGLEKVIFLLENGADLNIQAEVSIMVK